MHVLWWQVKAPFQPPSTFGQSSGYQSAPCLSSYCLWHPRLLMYNTHSLIITSPWILLWFMEGSLLLLTPGLLRFEQSSGMAGKDHHHQLAVRESLTACLSAQIHIHQWLSLAEGGDFLVVGQTAFTLTHVWTIHPLLLNYASVVLSSSISLSVPLLCSRGAHASPVL